MVSNKEIECFCLRIIAMIAVRWKFEALKTSLFDLAALPLGQIFVFWWLKTVSSTFQDLEFDGSF